MKKDTITGIAMLSLLLASLLVFGQSTGILSIMSYDDIYAQPSYGNLKCEPEGSYRHTEGFIGGDEYTYTCAKFMSTSNDADAPTCKIFFKRNTNIFNFGGAEIYRISIDGTKTHIDTRYLPSRDQWIELITLNQGEKIFIEMEGTLWRTLNKEDISLRSGFQPYHLIDTSKGAALTVVSDDCWMTQNVDYSKLSKLCSGTGCVQEGYPGKLGYNKFVNYVDTWYLSPIQGTTRQYGGKTVVCHPYESSYGLFEIVDFLDANDNIRKMVNAQRPIKEVDCCPEMPMCNPDYTFVDDPEDLITRECDMFHPCITSWMNHPTEYGKMVTTTCVDGTCVIDEVKDNECLDCDGICDKDYNCVSAKPPISGVDPITEQLNSLLILLGVSFFAIFMAISVIVIAMELKK